MLDKGNIHSTLMCLSGYIVSKLTEGQCQPKSNSSVHFKPTAIHSVTETDAYFKGKANFLHNINSLQFNNGQKRHYFL